MHRCRVWRVRDTGEGAQEPGNGRQVRSDAPCHSAPSSRVSNAETCSSTPVRCLTDHTRHIPTLHVIANSTQYAGPLLGRTGGQSSSAPAMEQSQIRPRKRRLPPGSWWTWRHGPVLMPSGPKDAPNATSLPATSGKALPSPAKPFSRGFSVSLSTAGPGCQVAWTAAC